MPRAQVIDASLSLTSESGFYPLEYDKHGVPYRWTGPELSFVFEMFVDRTTPKNIKMRFRETRFKGTQHLLQCRVDGEAIDTTLVEVDREFELHGVMPSRDHVGGSVISFSCPSVSSPAADGQSKDARLLGLMFRWLRVDPAVVALPTPEEAPKAAGALSKSSEQPSGRLRRRVKAVGNSSE
jgi:hypothetical protein